MNLPSPKNILIVGNGFDLDVGLPTSYGAFIQSSFFQDLLKENRTARLLNEKANATGWVDIENEFVEISNLYESEDAEHDFLSDYKKIKVALTSYINSLDYSMIDMTSKAIAVFDEFMNKEEILVVINFNYTKTIDLLMQKYPDKRAINFHIHGSSVDGNIVFGVHDSARIYSKHVFLRKAVSPGFQSNFSVGELMLKTENSVVIFGHSLGNTDHTQFSGYFSKNVYENDSIPQLSIYYHSEKSYYDIYEQLDEMTYSKLQQFKIEHRFEMCGPPV